MKYFNIYEILYLYHQHYKSNKMLIFQANDLVEK